MKKMMVTGAHGFMGSNLVRFLLERGHDVRAMVRPGGDFSTLDGLDVELFEADLTDAEALRAGCEGVHTIFHLASCTHEWNWWPVYKRINVDGTRDLLDAAVDAGVDRLVYMSSLAIHHFHGIKEGDESQPKDGFLFHGYARSKIETEAMLAQYHEEGKIKTVIIRPGVLPYGPNDKTHVKVFDAMMDGGWAYVNGGKALLSTVYIDNLAHGLLLAAQNDDAMGQTYIIADDYKMTWRSFSEAMCEALGAKKPKTSAPLFLAYSLGWFLESFYRLFKIKSAPMLTRYTVSLAGKDFYFLPKKAEKELGYKPIVSFEEGIQKTADWYTSTIKNK